MKEKKTTVVLSVRIKVNFFIVILSKRIKNCLTIQVNCLIYHTVRFNGPLAQLVRAGRS